MKYASLLCTALVSLLIAGCVSTPSLADVTIMVQAPASTTESDTLSLGANIADWDPERADMRLSKQADGRWAIFLQLVPGTALEFKITRGNWESVQKDEAGREVENYVHRVDEGPQTIEIAVAHWADRLPSGLPLATSSTGFRSGTLQTFDDFPATELGGVRRIWVYLPKDYEVLVSQGIRFPVLYLHDGQNVFDAQTSFAGEWGVDETLEALAIQGGPAGVIVVGVDNGGARRLDEYTPFPDSNGRGGKAGDYLNFLLASLKPWVDANYQTLPGPRSTAIGGSSLGGLVSLWAGLSRPDVFGNVLAFSPSIWFSQEALVRFARERSSAIQDTHIYLDAGRLEGGSMARDAQNTYELLLSLGLSPSKVKLVIDPEGRHNEAAWKRRFGPAWAWLAQGMSGVYSYSIAAESR